MQALSCVDIPFLKLPCVLVGQREKGLKISDSFHSSTNFHGPHSLFPSLPLSLPFLLFHSLSLSPYLSILPFLPAFSPSLHAFLPSLLINSIQQLNHILPLAGATVYEHVSETGEVTHLRDPNINIQTMKIYSPGGPRCGIVVLMKTQAKKKEWLHSISEVLGKDGCWKAGDYVFLLLFRLSFIALFEIPT